MTEGTHPLDELEETAHYFEELELGKRFPIPSRTMTDALFAAFSSPPATTIRFTTTWNTAAATAIRKCWRTDFRR